MRLSTLHPPNLENTPALMALILSKIVPSTSCLPERAGGQTESITLVSASIHASCSESKILALERDGERLPVRRLIWDLWGWGGEPPVWITSSLRKQHLRHSGLPWVRTWQWQQPSHRCVFLILSGWTPCFWHPVLSGVDLCLGMECLSWLWARTWRSVHTVFHGLLLWTRWGFGTLLLREGFSFFAPLISSGALFSADAWRGAAVDTLEA